MRVNEARAAAADWIREHGSRTPGFRGAYFSGSTVDLPADAPVPPGSDTDVMLVVDGPEPAAKPGKFRHLGALLEVTVVPWATLASPERVLSSYHLATPFRGDTVIADPTGDLGRLRARVAAGFAEPRWVLRRRAEARERVESGLRDLAPEKRSWAALVLGWLFPTGVTTHVLLVAALRNPTVRLRYVATRDLLVAHGTPDRHEELLRLLGSHRLTADRAEHHLRALAATFDAAAEVARTPFPFSSDLTRAARPIAIDGSLARIRAGDHREIAFWLAATFARCHLVLDADAPVALRDAHRPAFAELLADLGIRTVDDVRARAAAVLASLPTLDAWADEIRPPAAAER
ncbi:hypothetical protein E1265_12515 [Streptomyces sp. 8K308]|uniref:hypothetical protein n=1 Tax=Streptomyces sp. 8K308 TaxID=2530388 RepID=UPI00104C3E89|nr:hypothetical protein [Streptomyces sp. 8K308]TDC23547.1 hypothetical protein E1265_12515 [Streptomyces sp. 8K308]